MFSVRGHNHDNPLDGNTCLVIANSKYFIQFQTDASCSGRNCVVISRILFCVHNVFTPLFTRCSSTVSNNTGTQTHP